MIHRRAFFTRENLKHEFVTFPFDPLLIQDETKFQSKRSHWVKVMLLELGRLNVMECIENTCGMLNVINVLLGYLLMTN